MRFLAIASLVLLMAVHINTEEEKGPLDDILVYPIEAPASMKIEKRDTSKESSESFKEFLEEKLTEQSQALQHIVKSVDRHGELLKQLINYLSKNLEKPKLPVKLEPQKVKHSRRSNKNEEPENPILRLGRNIPKYGRLAKDLFLGEISSGTDPTPLVERDPEPTTVLEFTRRSNGGSPGIAPSQPTSEELSSWCTVAMLCAKTVDPVCGFDDHYGYGKFDDICHMLHVNCYYKYNFVLVHTCHPTI